MKKKGGNIDHKNKFVIAIFMITVFAIIIITYYINSQNHANVNQNNSNHNLTITASLTNEKTFKSISNLDYKNLKYLKEENTVIVNPTLTGFAYGENGFYSYYNKICDIQCLTINISGISPNGYATSQITLSLLRHLGYPEILDVDIDKNPNILNKYDKVILLHNEYVTKKIFDAITNHPNVIYLFPNTLYAEVNVDYEKNTMTLIKGHGYPVDKITNGFEWKYDNTHLYEYDKKCDSWKFYDIPNGKMLNCYPDNIIFDKLEILKKLKEF